MMLCFFFFFFQAEDGIRDAQESRGLGDVYKRQFNGCCIVTTVVIMISLLNEQPRSLHRYAVNHDLYLFLSSCSWVSLSLAFFSSLANSAIACFWFSVSCLGSITAKWM
eukprot:TRINITY_DN13898_c0_g1_i5.p1 TRINITY_DN13898_c0_g1~~TRINITY_DN13898_c0_g1_i5.p1  ORF type:complete len:109 (-),score=17.11 TRINITY_DN13898_c0_g1_i5:102-428(-)